ncbi:N4BP1 protein, partial [Amia calva]|nr:N4BP1 protein [Amia calva]
MALAVQYFWSRGHRKVTIFVPQWRQKKDNRVKEPRFMMELQTLGLLSFTPSREVKGQRINSYDDRFMLQLAEQTDGVIVTNDNLKDLVDESPAWGDIIKKRLLQYTFAGDHFMVPDDPLGRGGPHLDTFLSSDQRAPVPRSQSSSSSSHHCPLLGGSSELLQFPDWTAGGEREQPIDRQPAQADKHPAQRNRRADRSPAQADRQGDRSAVETDRLREELLQVFPGQDSVIQLALNFNPNLRDISLLSDIILNLTMKR